MRTDRKLLVSHKKMPKSLQEIKLPQQERNWQFLPEKNRQFYKRDDTKISAKKWKIDKNRSHKNGYILIWDYETFREIREILAILPVCIACIIARYLPKTAPHSTDRPHLNL